MIRKRKWLSAAALAGFAACSGEGSPDLPPVVDNTAPLADNLPPSDDQMAPADDQAPPSPVEPVSAGDLDSPLALCAAACSVPVAAPCSRGSDCITGCLESFREAGGCTSQLLDVARCAAQQALWPCSVDEDGEAQVEVPEPCRALIGAYEQCLDNQDVETAGSCTQAGGCVCADACQTCLCTMDSDSEGICDALCQ